VFQEQNRWSGQVYWGASNKASSNLNAKPPSQNLKVVISKSGEKEDFQRKVKKKSVDLFPASGDFK